jgi:DMSO/TMAO reductase YedYZ molybdopterin-dependent catalytic subunit
MAWITRRRFLTGAAGTTLALIIGCAPRDGSGSVAEPSTTQIDGEQGVAPDEIAVTPNDEFYLTQYSNPNPDVDIDAWSLKIDGLVDNPIVLNYDEVLALPSAEEMRTLECIGNPIGGDLIGNAVWKGFYLEALLKQVGIQPEAIRAQFAAVDGYQTSADLEWITQPRVLMAYEMNGEPLPLEHGFPLRILMPGLYGQKMPKWITNIHFTDSIKKGFWESRGWSDVASVQTNSQIWQPRNLNTVEGEVVVYGIAYAAPREILKVELGINGEEWIEAELLKGPSPLFWTQWSAVWQAPPGDYVLSVRATDSEGFIQASEGSGVLQGAFPNGTNGIHDIAVSVAEAQTS